MNHLINISDLNMGTIIIDCATIFLLVEMIVHTSLFRRRGWLSDKLFFTMLVTDIIIASTDAMNYALEYNRYSFAGKMIILGDTIFSLAFSAFAFLFAMYCFCQTGREAVVRFQWKIYAIPLFIISIFILANIAGGFMFSVDPISNSYQYGPLYNIIFIPATIYIIMTVSQIWKINKGLVLVFLGLVLFRVLLGVLLRGISSTAFVFAVGLSYTHICVMNSNFNMEVKV